MDDVSLSPRNIQDLLAAFDHFFPENTVYAADEPFFSGDFTWKNKKAFIDFIRRLTQIEIKDDKDVANIKRAQDELLNLLSGDKPKLQDSNRPTLEQLERGAKMAEEKKVETERLTKLSNEEVRAAIEKQKQLYQDRIKRAKEVEDKLNTTEAEVYIKETQLNKAALTKEQLKKIDDLKTQVRAKPEETAKDIQKIIIERLKSQIPESMPQAEFESDAMQAATDIVKNLHGDSKPIIKTAVIKTLSEHQELITNKVGVEDQTLFHDWTRELSNQQLSSLQLSQLITRAAFGQEFQSEVLPDYVVEVSPEPKDGFSKFSLDTIPQEYSQVAKNQVSFLDSIQSFGEDEIKSKVYANAGQWLNSQIAKLPADSALSTLYNNSIVQASLSYFGLGAPVEWVATNSFGRLALSLGMENTFGWMGQITGSSFFGVAKAAAPLATEALSGTSAAVGSEIGAAATGTVIGTTAGGAIAAVGGEAMGAQIGAAVSSLIPLPGIQVIGAAIGTFVGWVSTKIPWHKVREYGTAFAGGFAGLAVFPFLGLSGALAIGGLTFGTATALTGGLPALGSSLSGVVSGVSVGTGFVLRTFLAQIGTPILVIFIGFPVVVAFMLFIINSGAYVVPPGTFEGGGGIVPADCLGDPPPKPNVSNVRYSADGKYAYPVAPFEVPGYACFHWNGKKAVDIFSPMPRPPLVAYETGKIVNVTLNDSDGGKYIIMQGTESKRHYYYAHLCHVYVEGGDDVRVGDVIGTMDETGNGRVEHLHYAINTLPLSSDFVGGVGNVCPQEDFEEKFNFGICNPSNYCIKP